MAKRASTKTTTSTKTTSRKPKAKPEAAAALQELVESPETAPEPEPEPEPTPEPRKAPSVPQRAPVATTYQGMAGVCRPARVKVRQEPAKGHPWWVKEGLAGQVVDALAMTYVDGGNNQRTALIYDGDGEATATFIEAGGDGPYRLIQGEEL